MASTTSPNVQSAVAFLRDPSVQDSPLAKKVAFLEAKGLSQTEIDTALRVASSSSSSSPSPSTSTALRGYNGQQPYGYSGYPQNPAAERMAADWRDWFIMAVVGGGVGAVMYALARKYLLPALRPPSTSELTTAQDALSAKYDEAARILEQLSAETSEIRETLAETCEKVGMSVGQVDAALAEIKEKEESRDDEFKAMREEVDAIKGLMEKMFDKHKDAQTSSLNDIQQEVKSLKSLLQRRSEAPASNSNSTSTSTGTPAASAAAPASSSSSAAGAGPISGPAAAATSSQPAYTSPYASPYSSMPNRFGLGGSGSGSVSPSASFANIANRPPGIPAWQLQSSSSSGSGSGSNSLTASASTPNFSTAANTPAQTASKATSEEASVSADAHVPRQSTATVSEGSVSDGDQKDSVVMVENNETPA